MTKVGGMSRVTISFVMNDDVRELLLFRTCVLDNPSPMPRWYRSTLSTV